jgi:peptidoglycan/LPS O-acetylase OafA/YrhL
MGQIQIEDPKNERRYDPCLAGIRGYGFLLVFCAHYFRPELLAKPGTLRFNLLWVLASPAVFAVPAFFVLSGYLIGGILYHTRNREGFFRVFYTRRVLRVFPVYYVTLLAIAAFDVIKHVPLDFRFWSHFLYIQNLLPGPSYRAGSVVMTHFWSLAVEEQFYLIWPLVVWRFRDRRKLIAVISGLVVVCCLIRLAAPVLSISASRLGYFTPTRADAILAGVLLSLVCENNLYRRLVPVAKWATIAGVITAALLTFYKGAPWAYTYVGRDVSLFLANVTAVGIVVAVMEQGSLLNRLCSQRWVCWLGALSYSLYIFHLTFSNFFIYYLTPRFDAHMRHSLALLASSALAFCTTLGLSVLSYRLIEGPIMRFKRHIKYGAARAHVVSQEIGEPALMSAGD